MTKKIIFIALTIFGILNFTSCQKSTQKSADVNISKVDYSKAENWAYLENSEELALEKSADVFFICPTVYGGSEEQENMLMTDSETKANFLGATNMEKGIYDDDARFFAPYYQQVGLHVYTLPFEEREKFLAKAYSDVKKSFEYYLENYNNRRPVILAGFSQGGDMCIRLMKDFFDDENLNSLLVACYAIGWNITEKEILEYPHLKFASSEFDTGVIVSFNSEAEHIDDSLTIPKGIKTLAINPLNWKTDNTPADKSLNMGACFTDYDGNILSEIPNLTGAYIDNIRGALKVTDIIEENYPPVLDIFESGIYHLYDYQFFYRNLEKNVQTRINCFYK